GFAGIGWLTAHLARILVDVEASAFDDIDDCLLGILTQPTRPHFDLISGLVGYGVYGLERFPSPSARALLERIIELLDLTAVQELSGTTWQAPFEFMAEWERTQCEDLSTLRNLGLAHGVPGIIAFLAKCCHLGVPRAEPLLESTMRWLTQQEGGCAND